MRLEQYWFSQYCFFIYFIYEFNLYKFMQINVVIGTTL